MDPVFAGYSWIRQNRIQIRLRFKAPDPDPFRLYEKVLFPNSRIPANTLSARMVYSAIWGHVHVRIIRRMGMRIPSWW